MVINIAICVVLIRHPRLIVPELLDVPIRIEQAQVHHTHILTNPLHLLKEPQWERIVVSIGEEDRILLTCLKYIVGIVIRNIVIRTIMGVKTILDDTENNTTSDEDENKKDNTQVILLVGGLVGGLVLTAVGVISIYMSMNANSQVNRSSQKMRKDGKTTFVNNPLQDSKI